MNDRNDLVCAQPREGYFPARAWRSIAASLISVLILLAQIGPALACDVFDGPGESGCPALFHSDPVDQLGDDHRRAPDDCSRGPSYLALDVETLQLNPQVDGDDHVIADGWALAATREFLALQDRRSEIAAIRSTAVGAAAQERYAYLRTLRLRI
jgi:hypothetical protein